MQKEQDRVAAARAVRRRLADHRMAAQLKERGWTVKPPADEIERKVAARERAA